MIAAEMIAAEVMRLLYLQRSNPAPGSLLICPEGWPECLGEHAFFHGDEKTVNQEYKNGDDDEWQ
jgi:hypothetical protein